MIHKTYCSCLVKRCTPGNIVASRRVHNGELDREVMPPGAGPYTCEPCLDVNPRPDYENVLTD